MDIFLFCSSVMMSRLYFIKDKQDIVSNKINSHNNHQYNQKKTIGLAFGVTGGLFAYSLGIAKYLESTFDLSSIVTSGISGGCQPSLFLLSNISIDQVLNQWLIPSMNDLKKDQNLTFLTKIFKIITGNIPLLFCGLDLSTVMKRSKRHLGRIQTFHQMELYHDKYHLLITQLFPPKKLSISNWKNFDDMYSGIEATQFIPFYFGHPLGLFRNKLCCDGYLSSRHFYPDSQNIDWIGINVFKMSKRHPIVALTSLANMTNLDFHRKEYQRGYCDAESNHQYFVDCGLVMV